MIGIVDLKTIDNYKEKIEKEIILFFKSKKKEAKGFSDDIYDVICDIEEFILRGGKRLRPLLMTIAYTGCGGKNINEAVKAAVATEIIHAFLLIHDDIIDNDDLRRGNSTMHISLAKKYGKGYGSSLAIIAGDIGFCLALEALQNTSFDEKRKMRVLEVLVPMVKKTCYGEYLDVLAEINDVDEDYIRKIHQNKTAYYTMAGPMKMGALLAGASKQKLNDLNKIGIKLGLAFQLRDDILGVFGDEKLLGKPVASDLIEGKKTLLIVKANSSYINNKIGNKLSIKEIDKIRDIIVKSGSLEYSQELIESLLEAAKKDINKITLRKKEKELLLYLVNYLGKRRS